jgi:hypothetical protein
MKVFEKCGIFRREDWIVQGNVAGLLPCRCMSDAVEMGWVYTQFLDLGTFRREKQAVYWNSGTLSGFLGPNKE